MFMSMEVRELELIGKTVVGKIPSGVRIPPEITAPKKGSCFLGKRNKHPQYFLITAVPLE